MNPFKIKLARLLFVIFLSLIAIVALWIETNKWKSYHHSLLPVVRTETPRQTLESFEALRQALASAIDDYQRDRSVDNFMLILTIDDDIISLIDVSDVAASRQREVGITTAVTLFDIMDLISPIDMQALPGDEAMLLDGTVSFGIPGTPLRIERIDEGSRSGEFLFADSSIRIAPRFLRALQSASGQSASGQSATSKWGEQFTQFAGPLVPFSIVEKLPEAFKKPLMGMPAWKLCAMVVCIVLGVVLLVILRRQFSPKEEESGINSSLSQVLFAIVTLLMLLLLRYLIYFQINVSGPFADAIMSASIVAIFAILAILFWHSVIAIFETVAVNRSISEDSLDGNLLRLIARILALVGSVWILAYGAQELGLPILSILAGLGIGGVAVALAIRPTLENLLGGFVLYIDKPIRLGDFCGFGEHQGFVERIGVRSTQIRALDRTLITIPNAQFADMMLINWAECDKMMIDQTLNLRYETSTDQLRYVLAELRRMMHAHPRIDNDTVRVRFSGYGASSLDIDIRVYAKTREWNDFFAIREDVFFRIKDIVEASGTSFAFPSRTLYVSRDEGLDEEKSRQADQTVQRWRKRRELPFPRFPSKMRQRFDDTLHYPPYGSPESLGLEEAEISTLEEPLSAPSEPVAVTNEAAAEADDEQEHGKDEPGSAKA